MITKINLEPKKFAGWNRVAARLHIPFRYYEHMNDLTGEVVKGAWGYSESHRMVDAVKRRKRRARRFRWLETSLRVRDTRHPLYIQKERYEWKGKEFTPFVADSYDLIYYWVMTPRSILNAGLKKMGWTLDVHFNEVYKLQKIQFIGKKWQQRG